MKIKPTILRYVCETRVPTLVLKHEFVYASGFDSFFLKWTRLFEWYGLKFKPLGPYHGWPLLELNCGRVCAQEQ